MEVKGRIPILCQCHWPRSKSIPAYSLPLHVFTTGYRRLASIISPETQSASKGQLRWKGSPPCFWHIGTPAERKAWRQSLWAKRSNCVVPNTKLNHVGSDTTLCVLEYTQVNFTESVSHILKSGWKDWETGHFFHDSSWFWWESSETQRKREEYERGQRENKSNTKNRSK